MWLNLVAAVGMATLAIPVARSRHELAAPLGALIADMLIRTLAWLAYDLSGDLRWRWTGQCAAALMMLLGLNFVLTFVGRRRALGGLRVLVHLFVGGTFASAASRFVAPGDALYVGDELWWRLMIVGRVGIGIYIGSLLIGHHRSNHDAAERAHTRLLIIGFVLWIVLSITDLLHHRIGSVPQMSAIGMLLSVAVMAIVMDRVRPDGPSRWWAGYTLALFVVAVCGNVVVFKTLPAMTAMMLASTVIFLAAGLGAAREVIVMVIRRRQRLAELALLGRVTAQMAHDLQNPLAAIKCATQVIEEDRLRGLGGGDGSRQRRMLETIGQQAERMSAIVDDYRRVGRIEPRTESISLVEVMGRTARPANVTVHSQLAGVPRCLADPELVTRAVENLVRNAAEAMPDGGRISVSAQTVGDGASAWVELTVADDGPGMDARTCERAFDDFFTTKANGSGLGLAFVRRVAEVHGGAARIASRIGSGTRVTLRLPAAFDSNLRSLHMAYASA